MTRIEIISKIRVLRDELENRTKYGTVKIANKDGSVPTILQLQNDLYSLVYRLSKFE